MFKEVLINCEGKELNGYLSFQIPPKAWIIFAHGSGSSRDSPRNNWVAQLLNLSGFGTLLFDLLTDQEDAVFQNRFNIPLLGQRLQDAAYWLLRSPFYNGAPLVFFGASTGAGAALHAAARMGNQFPLIAVISRGGRPDLAGRENLVKVHVPTLLIVGAYDHEVIKLNQEAKKYLFDSKLVLVPGATHLFEEEGALKEVVDLAQSWILTHLFQSSRQESEHEL